MRSRSFACSSFGLTAPDFFGCVNFFRFRMASPLRTLYGDQSLHYASSSPLGAADDDPSGPCASVPSISPYSRSDLVQMIRPTLERAPHLRLVLGALVHSCNATAMS